MAGRWCQTETWHWSCRRSKRGLDFFYFYLFFFNLGNVRAPNVRFLNVTRIKVKSSQSIADVESESQGWALSQRRASHACVCRARRKETATPGVFFTPGWLEKPSRGLFVLYAFVRVSTRVPPSQRDAQTLTHHRLACLFQFCSDAAWL